jgi:predicted nucleic-acid-binding protein
VKLAVDTNVLVRGAVRDDAAQAVATDKLLRQASLIAVSLPCLCEFTWVVPRVYGVDPVAVTAAIRAMLETGKMVMNRPAVEAGLAMLEAGGDFADGVMAHAGFWLGGEIFVSFDRKAVALFARQGISAELLV